jgi:hypothetical protein
MQTFILLKTSIAVIVNLHLNEDRAEDKGYLMKAVSSNDEKLVLRSIEYERLSACYMLNCKRKHYIK